MRRRLVLSAGLLSGIAALASLFGRTLPVNSRPGEQQDFLGDLQQRCYRFQIEAADPETGLVADRGRTDGSWFSDHASSAACGFALAGHGIAAQRGWVDSVVARDRVRRMLTALMEKVEHERGFVYHFIDRSTGKRAMQCEASSIDTALLVAGAMHASQVFADDARIVSLADALYRRVQWRWLLGDNNCLHMGWKPETGRLPYQWDVFSELTILVLLAIGAPEHQISGECWNAWRREKELHHKGEPFLSYPPLFVHQYPQAFFDFRGVASARGRSYWQNSRTGHLAQIAFLKALSKTESRFEHYGDDLWGITSSDSATGYRDWGGPYEDGVVRPDRGIDGTVVPSAAGGGLAIVPDQALHTLMHQRQLFDGDLYGRYGFANAFNPATNWIGPDVIGIDTGITLLAAANLTHQATWKPFMQHPAARRALNLAGFRATS